MIDIQTVLQSVLIMNCSVVPDDRDIQCAKDIHHKSSQLHGGRHRNNADPRMMDRLGPIGWLAKILFAKLLGILYTPNITDDKTPDVGGYDVYQTGYQNGSLIIQKYDKPDRITILAVGDDKQMKFVGWIKNIDGMKSKYFGQITKNRRRPPVYAVPQSVLHPMDTLEPFRRRLYNYDSTSSDEEGYMTSGSYSPNYHFEDSTSSEEEDNLWTEEYLDKEPHMIIQSTARNIKEDLEKTLEPFCLCMYNYDSTSSESSSEDCAYDFDAMYREIEALPYASDFDEAN